MCRPVTSIAGSASSRLTRRVVVAPFPTEQDNATGERSGKSVGSSARSPDGRALRMVRLRGRPTCRAGQRVDRTGGHAPGRPQRYPQLNVAVAYDLDGQRITELPGRSAISKDAARSTRPFRGGTRTSRRSGNGPICPSRTARK